MLYLVLNSVLLYLKTVFKTKTEPSKNSVFVCVVLYCCDMSYCMHSAVNRYKFWSMKIMKTQVLLKHFNPMHLLLTYNIRYGLILQDHPNAHLSTIGHLTNEWCVLMCCLSVSEQDTEMMRYLKKVFILYENDTIMSVIIPPLKYQAICLVSWLINTIRKLQNLQPLSKLGAFKNRFFQPTFLYFSHFQPLQH